MSDEWLFFLDVIKKHFFCKNKTRGDSCIMSKKTHTNLTFISNSVAGHETSHCLSFDCCNPEIIRALVQQKLKNTLVWEFSWLPWKLKSMYSKLMTSKTVQKFFRLQQFFKFCGAGTRSMILILCNNWQI